MMKSFQELKAESLKALFIKEMEDKILSGELKPGDRLPPERNMSSQMGISRSIVNAGMVELAAKGFVAIKPRKGTVVLDFRTEGTPQMLSSIMNYNHGKLDMELFYSLMETRMLLEVESARLAAVNRKPEDLKALKNFIATIKSKEKPSITEIADFNFLFHYRVVMASGNIIFSMIFKSFEPVCKSLITKFFSRDGLLQQSLKQHEALYDSILHKDSSLAADSMKSILLTGISELELLNKDKEAHNNHFFLDKP